jgi:predicted MPP superfamily phosphohydrolase
LLVISLAKAQPGALILLGDMVYQASDAEHWTYFDQLMDPVRKAKIPTLALLGNHEYYGNDADARGHLNKRFPRLSSTEYYDERFGKLALLLLNSNKDELSSQIWDGQLKWYQERLKTFDGDSAVDGILVLLHHPPYTGSEVAQDDRELATDFLDGFSRSHKTLAMISGHAHGYEHVQKGKKHYIISAGGGGPLQPRNKTSLSKASLSSALFNYLLIEQDDKRIEIKVMGLAERESRVKLLSSLKLPFAPPQTAAR